jgi:thioredoxin reductase
MEHRQLVIIGGGPAGLAAAIEARTEGIEDIFIIEREKELGGILNQCIHSGFGLHIFNEELTGPEYAARFIERVRRLNIGFAVNTAVLNISSDRIVTSVNADHGLFHIKADAVILAMGCRERTRGALNIPGTRPAGIFTAGTAQKFVNIDGYLPGKKIVILGSGDIGLIMARRLTLEGAEVRMVCEIMPYSNGLTRNIVQCLEDYGIPLRLNHTVVDVHGAKRLEGVTVARVDEYGKPVPESREYVECDTLLLSVGLIPENELSREAGVDIDPVTMGPVVNESMETSIGGVFACGNVVHVHDLVDYATLESMLAGRRAAAYIKGSLAAENADSRPVRVKAGAGVRYVVPQMVHKSRAGDEIKLFFRARDVYRDVAVTVKSGSKAVFRRKKARVAPGEMESIIIKRDALEALPEDGDLVVSVEGDLG